MANQDQVEILKKGAKVWNEWRSNHTNLFPDLREADFRGKDLREADFSYAKLRGAIFREAYLVDANLREADLCDANLRAANLGDADLSGANFSGADLVAAYLNRANLLRVKLIKADLRGADLGGADLNSTDLSGANLKRSSLLSTVFRNTSLREADLRGAILNDTIITDVDLSQAMGLEEIIHYGPSSIGIDTIFKSKGKIPHKFLRGAGVPEIFIGYMSSLTGEAFYYYSCFISYSSKDEDFVKRLYADLQTEGVRCWFAPEDLKIGQKIRQGIDFAIRNYDKLLIILSESSVKSDWVETEVETAFEREKKEKKTVLFPVRLDEAVFNTKVAWAADIRRTRHIGDFTKWQNHDDYKKAFDRLIRDLKAEDNKVKV